jgi:transcriptional regulator with XRE-family HTH domain
MTQPEHIAFTRRFKAFLAEQPHQVEVANRLRYSPARVNQIARGERPSREFVERFIDAYDLDREEWLGLAGYGPRPSAEDEQRDLIRRTAEEVLRRTGLIRDEGESYNAPTGAQILARGLADLAREYGKEAGVIPVALFGGTENLTPDEARQRLVTIRQLLDEGHV